MLHVILIQCCDMVSGIFANASARYEESSSLPESSILQLENAGSFVPNLTACQEKRFRGRSGFRQVDRAMFFFLIEGEGQLIDVVSHFWGQLVEKVAGRHNNIALVEEAAGMLIEGARKFLAVR